VLIHGDTPAAGNTWLPQRPLRDRWTLLMPDRFGFGASPPTERIDAAVDAAAVVDAMSAPTHVVGHSHGAVVALLVAAARPDLVRSLVVVEPPLVRLLPTMSAMPSSEIDQGAKAMGMPGDGASHRRFPLDAWQAGRRPWDVEIDFAALAEHAIPTLVVSGGWSPMLDAVCDAMAVQIGGRRVTVAGADHDVHHAREAFNQMLHEFWTTIEDGSEHAR
jgi:pimeloyl-ACP methyl ester carboxylesterase